MQFKYIEKTGVTNTQFSKHWYTYPQSEKKLFLQISDTMEFTLFESWNETRNVHSPPIMLDYITAMFIFCRDFSVIFATESVAKIPIN